MKIIPRKYVVLESDLRTDDIIARIEKSVLNETYTFSSLKKYPDAIFQGVIKEQNFDLKTIKYRSNRILMKGEVISDNGNTKLLASFQIDNDTKVTCIVFSSITLLIFFVLLINGIISKNLFYEPLIPLGMSLFSIGIMWLKFITAFNYCIEDLKSMLK